MTRRVRNKPRVVWRVERKNRYCEEYGLQSRGDPHFQDNQDYEWQRQRHLNWDWSLNSPFQSTFSNKIHAIRWGHRLYPGGKAVVYEIETRFLRTDYGGQDDEFLIVGDIPPDNVIRITRLKHEYDDMLAQQRQQYEPKYDESDSDSDYYY